MQITTHPQLIEKEFIPTLNFSDDVIVDQHPDLKKQIEQAVRLGNAYHSKVSILFYDSDGCKRVDTTIWAYGSKYICLKGGTWLPVSHIIEIII